MGESQERMLSVLRQIGRRSPEDLPPEIRRAARAVLGVLENVAPTLGPGIAAGIAVAVSDALHREGAAPAPAGRIADRVEARRRRRLIRREFNGRNHNHLARRFGVSVRTVRRIVDRPHNEAPE